MSRAKEIAEVRACLLREKYDASRVMLFGSLTGKTVFHVRSDVDLAAWGIKERDYYRAVADLLLLDPEIEVDLVLYDLASPELQEVIQSQGEAL